MVSKMLLAASTTFLGFIFVASLFTDGFSSVTGSAVDLHTDRDVTVDFYVMSFCPYGQQAEAALQPVYNSFKNEVSFEPHYVIYSGFNGGGPSYCLDSASQYCSMHGVNEAKEDVRQLCVWKYYSEDQWWNYVSCINSQTTVSTVENKWQSCALSAGIDSNKIQSCYDNEGMNLIAADKALGDSNQVAGSPTIFINGQSYQGARTPEACAQAICSVNSNLTSCSDSFSGVSSLPTNGGGCGV